MYLLWLGVGVLRNRPVPTVGDERAAGSWSGWLLRGFGISGMNPKALLLFLALLPQFTSREAPWPILAQIGAMGLVQIVNCAAVYCLAAFGSKVVLRARPTVARTVS